MNNSRVSPEAAQLRQQLEEPDEVGAQDPGLPALGAIERLERDERAAFAELRAHMASDARFARAWEDWQAARRALVNAQLEEGAESSYRGITILGGI